MANNHKLTEGALMTIMRGGEVVEPIVQVLGSKKISSGSAEQDRYRLLISDGLNSISFAMMTTQVNSNLSNLMVNTIIKLKRYITSLINSSTKADKRVLLLLELETVVPASEVGGKIGDPIAITDEMIQSQPAKAPSRETGTTNEATNRSTTVTGSFNPIMPGSSHNIGSRIISPISSLSPYHNKWVIRARLTNKSPIRTWSNSRGEGKLFNFDLLDESGEIRVTGFRDMVDKYYDYLKIDQIYYVSKCQVKPANRKFSNLKNDYEMSLSSESVIEECNEEDVALPQTIYDFVTLDKVAVMQVDTMVDVIAVVKTATDIQTFKARATGRELKKKDLTLVDQSKTAMTLSLWGAQAEEFDGSNNPVVTIKGARIGEFGGGKNLSTVSSTLIKTNPDTPECHKLKGWYDLEGSNAELTNVSKGDSGFETRWLTFRDVQRQKLGRAEKGDYYQVPATILMIRTENCVYKSCPGAECNKKVVDMEDGTFRCEKCDKNYDNFNYRLMLHMNIADWTGNQWISVFCDESEKVLKKTSQEIGTLFAEDPFEVTMLFESVAFKQYSFKCRSKVEVYRDEERLKTAAVRIAPINHEEYNKYLIERIGQYVS